MKRWIKGTLIAGGVLLGAGALMVGAGLLLGARPGAIVMKSGKFRYVEWGDQFDGFRQSLEELDREKQDHTGKELTGDLEGAGEYEGVTELDLELFAADVHLQQGPAGSKVVVVLDDRAKKRGVSLSREDGTLKLYQDETPYERYRNLGGAPVWIQIPEDLLLAQVEVEMDMGTVEAHGLQAKRLEADVDLGEVEFTAMKAEELSLYADMGTVSYEGEVGSRVAAECDMGEITLLIKGKKEDFTYSASAQFGSVQIGGSETDGGEASAAGTGGGSKYMELDTDLGSITVNFYE